MSRTFAVILAGGHGSRLGGVRKADLRIGGVRLLHRVAGAVQPKVDSLLVASGAFPRHDLPNTTAIEDYHREPTGPLAGIRAAVAHLAQDAHPDDLLISVAVDTPFLPSDYVNRLTEAISGADAAYASWGDNFYPTNAVWRLGALISALNSADEAAGPRAILTLMGAEPVDWSTESHADPFANLNTLTDLLALQRRAKGR